MKNIVDDINNNFSSLIKKKMDIKNNDIRSRYKIYLGGDTYSGKTSFISRIIDNKFDLNTTSTVCSSYSPKDRRINNVSLSFDIWDSIRWDLRYEKLIKCLLKDSDGILLLFALYSCY